MLPFQPTLNLAFCLLLLFHLDFVFSCASPHKKTATPSPKRFPIRPSWLRASTCGPSKNTWNLFGQWFNQRTSSPYNEHPIHLTSIENVSDTWMHANPLHLSDLNRVDLFIFKTGLKPFFSTLIERSSSYVLSYKIPYSISKDFHAVETSNDSAEPSQKPGRFSRNQAKTLREQKTEKAEKAASEGKKQINELPPHPVHPLQAFDFIISSAINASGESSTLSSSIFGFNLARKFSDNFFQVFIDASNISALDADLQIREMIMNAYPGCACIKPPMYFWIPEYASKLGRLILSPSKSPLKDTPDFPKRIVLTNTSFSDDDGEAQSEISDRQGDEELLLDSLDSWPPLNANSPAEAVGDTGCFELTESVDLESYMSRSASTAKSLDTPKVFKSLESSSLEDIIDDNVESVDDFEDNNVVYSSLENSTSGGCNAETFESSPAQSIPKLASHSPCLDENASEIDIVNFMVSDPTFTGLPSSPLRNSRLTVLESQIIKNIINDPDFVKAGELFKDTLNRYQAIFEE